MCQARTSLQNFNLFIPDIFFFFLTQCSIKNSEEMLKYAFEYNDSQNRKLKDLSEIKDNMNIGNIPIAFHLFKICFVTKPMFNIFFPLSLLYVHLELDVENSMENIYRILKGTVINEIFIKVFQSKNSDFRHKRVELLYVMQLRFLIKISKKISCQILICCKIMHAYSN